MLIEKKVYTNLYGDYNIIDHLASSGRHSFFCIFDESEGGKCFAILNRKNHSQYGKIHATQKNA